MGFACIIATLTLFSNKLPNNHHTSIICIDRQYIIDYLLLFEIFIESDHFLAEFDDIVYHDDSSFLHFRPSKSQEFHRPFFTRIDKSKIKRIIRKSWNKFKSISEIQFDIRSESNVLDIFDCLLIRRF